MNRSRWILLGVVALVIVVFVTLVPDSQTVIRQAEVWREMVHNHLFVSVVAFFIAVVVAIALSLPISFWLSALGGFLFGLWIGAAVVSIAAVLGALLAFLSARYLFAEKIHSMASNRPRLNRMLTRIDSGLDQHGTYYIVLLRLTPIFPFWMLNLGLGLTRVRARDYWWATQIGIIPVTFVVVNAGSNLRELFSAHDLLSWRVLGALCLLPLVAFALHHAAGRWMANGRREPAGDEANGEA